METFEGYLREKEKSEKTIEAYLKDISQFKTYIKEKEIEHITNSTLKDYRDYLLYERFLTPTTVNRKMVAIHQYCIFNDITVFSIKAKFQLQNFLDNIITQEETERMIKKAYDNRDYRTVALISTLSLTGMRISEVLSLTIKDINKSTIQILGKGKKLRMVFIPSKLNKIWRLYCAEGRNNKVQTDALFVGQRGKMTDKGTDRLIKKYAMLCNIPKDKAHHHSWRHGYILRLLEKGVSLEECADLVGHSNINITKGYARKTKEQLLNIIEDLD